MVDLLRLVRGGDMSKGAVWFCEAMIGFLLHHWMHIKGDPQIVPAAIFTFLRVAADHSHNSLRQLQAKEMDFCLRLWEAAPRLCAVAGRDLVRLLQNVAVLGAARDIWRSLLASQGPIKLETLLHTKTPKALLTARLTHEMEKQLLFIMTKVKQGGSARYQAWFKAQYLTRDCSDSLICDFIRYIVSNYHPPNRVISSDVVPRYQMISWLLGCIKTSHAAQNAKFSLFLDWFAYEKDSGDIMYIEPGILLIENATKENVRLASTMLEFLCLISEHYLQVPRPGQRMSPGPEFIRQGITAAFVDTKRLGVIQSLSSTCLNPALDPVLKDHVAARFNIRRDAEIKPDLMGVATIADRSHTAVVAASIESAEITRSVHTPQSPSVIFKDLVSILAGAQTGDDRTSAIHAIVQRWNTQQDYSSSLEYLTNALAPCVYSGMNASSVGTSSTAPHTALFEYASNTERWDGDSDEGKASTRLHAHKKKFLDAPPDRRVVQLLAELHERIEKLGFYFLAYLQRQAQLAANEADAVAVVRAYCAFAMCFDQKVDVRPGANLLACCLIRDLTIGSDEDVEALHTMMPFIFSFFGSAAIANAGLIRCFVTSMDASQLQHASTQVALGLLHIFTDSPLPTIPANSPSQIRDRLAAQERKAASALQETLEWETFEQMCVWELFACEMQRHESSVTRRILCQLLPALDPASHAEAVLGVTRILYSLHGIGSEFTQWYSLLLASGGRLGVSAAHGILCAWAKRMPKDSTQDYLKLLLLVAQNFTHSLDKKTANKQCIGVVCNYFQKIAIDIAGGRHLSEEAVSSSILSADANAHVKNVLSAQFRLLRDMTIQGLDKQLEKELCNQKNCDIAEKLRSLKECPVLWEECLDTLFKPLRKKTNTLAEVIETLTKRFSEKNIMGWPSPNNPAGIDNFLKCTANLSISPNDRHELYAWYANFHDTRVHPGLSRRAEGAPAPDRAPKRRRAGSKQIGSR